MSSSNIQNLPWSIIASLGYTYFENGYQNDGQTVLGRLAIDKELYHSIQIAIGAELGVQNGNTMRLTTSNGAIDTLGGLPIQTTIKPILDLLVTVKTEPFIKLPAFGLVKGGVAYRQWQLNDRTSVNNIQNIAGEVQAGLGMTLNQQASLSLLYQGIYGGNPNFQTNAIKSTGHLNNIPIQQGILFSLSYNV